MGTRGRAVAILAYVMLFILSGPLSAQWVEDGIPVCTASNQQEMVHAVPDGEGGVILVWRDTECAKVLATERYWLEEASCVTVGSGWLWASPQ